MIPLFMTVRVQARGGPDFRLWLPLFLAWPLILPLMVLLTPFFAVFWLARGVNPVTATTAVWVAMGSLSGLCVDVDSPTANVLVRII